MTSASRLGGACGITSSILPLNKSHLAAESLREKTERKEKKRVDSFQLVVPPKSSKSRDDQGNRISGVRARRDSIETDKNRSSQVVANVDESAPFQRLLSHSRCFIYRGEILMRSKHHFSRHSTLNIHHYSRLYDHHSSRELTQPRLPSQNCISVLVP